MSLFTLSFTLGFVVIAFFLSMWFKLGLQKDILIAAIRATIQLLIIGYILKVVFHLQDSLFSILLIALMIGVATQNASKRGKWLPHAWIRVLIAITITEVVAQGLLLGLKVVAPTPQYVIPISGMIVGNAMVASGLLLNRLHAETSSHRQEILTILALGGTPKQSVYDYVKQAVRASMIPTIDNTKTMGLVQLPGMMTGLIIAGADPIQAVRYQILIVFSILASAVITSIVLGFISYPGLFNEYQQFVLSESSMKK